MRPLQAPHGHGSPRPPSREAALAQLLADYLEAAEDVDPLGEWHPRVREEVHSLAEVAWQLRRAAGVPLLPLETVSRIARRVGLES